MKKFSFSMQYLSDFRATKKQTAEQALATALKEQAEAEYLLKFLINRREHMVREVELIQGVIPRSTWSEKMRCLQEFERRISERRHELLQRNEQVQHCREVLKNEVKECRILENIEKSERSRWSESMRVEEQKLMDELAAGRWFRREERV